jgi:eukaryotic-like serine/threonine-protein kinase
MSADRDPFDDLLASISDGRPIDWDAAAHATPSAAGDRLAALREMSQIAEFNRKLQRTPDPAQQPARWGDLLLLERIGSGARADVYRAWDPALQREVALKLIRPNYDDATLLDEGRAAARVRHPNVVSVLGIDRHDGRVGLWMELVRGATLDHEVRTRGPLSMSDAARLARELGAALCAVHDAGLLHRDVTPANVVRGPEGRFVLADFGLGLRGDEAAAGAPGLSGTPMYMAPEVLAGGSASERADQYGLGMVIWYALAGRHPFDVSSFHTLAEATQRGPDVTLSTLRTDVPSGFASVVAGAIAPDPGVRFTNVRAFFAALDQALEAPAASSPAAPAPAAARRGPLLAAISALALLALIAAWWTIRARSREPAPAVQQAAPQTPVYAVDATLMRRDGTNAAPLASGDRVKPGDHLSLELHSSLPVWAYVLNEDEHGERYLLFPQPRFDLQNPLPADSAIALPGPIGGNENAWTVTSAGGRERFLVVVSPEPVAEIEADLERLPEAAPGRPVEYASIGRATMERLRGVGGVTEVPHRPAAPTSSGFEAYRALAGRETGVRGIWVRQIVLENP